MAYASGVKKRDAPLLALAGSFRARVVDTSHSPVGGVAAYFGFDSFDRIAACMRNGDPFLHMDHAYFKRGYEHGNFRVNFGHFHQTRLIAGLPNDRMVPWRKRVMPWRTGGRLVVVVVPSERICQVLSAVHGITIKPKEWAREVSQTLAKHTDRPIMVKEKGAGLAGALEMAHAVVSLSSVAEVEAARFGVPVFAGEDSPASPIAEPDITRIESPRYPDREDWLRTLSYSQFHTSELSSGKAKRIIEELYGDWHLRGTANGSF